MKFYFGLAVLVMLEMVICFGSACKQPKVDHDALKMGKFVQIEINDEQFMEMVTKTLGSKVDKYFETWKRPTKLYGVTDSYFSAFSFRASPEESVARCCNATLHEIVDQFKYVVFENFSCEK